jgi:thiamine-monophosphate kinase
MAFSDIGEFGFIRRMTRGGLVRAEGVIKAIGDDAAVFQSDPDRVSLVTTDLLVERIHFLRDRISGRDLGHKSLAVNLSDIAAMGGVPREAFISIGIPDDCGLDYLDDFYQGMKALADRYAVNLLGGDTTGSRRDLIINIAVIGLADPWEIRYRDMARPGDIICVTGPLGNSRAGLHLLLADEPEDVEAFPVLLSAHQRPEPAVDEGRFLAEASGVRALIDVSDGVSSDLMHILEESDAGARIEAEKLPLSPELKAFCHRLGEDPIDWALAGGEDYVLLCTLASDRAQAIREDFATRFGRPLTPIGEITDTGKAFLIRNGSATALTPSGWDHFSPTPQNR